jgi:hypothetical protein
MGYFPAINISTSYTLDYFNIGRIREQIAHFAGGSNLSYLDSMHKSVLNWHNLMDSEINQHIHGSTPNLQSQMFEHLRSNLDAVKSWGSDDIHYLIEEYNKKEEKRFYAEIEERVTVHQNSKQYLERSDGEEWEEKVQPAPLWAMAMRSLGYIDKRVHHKIIEVTGGPDVIDLAYVDRYIAFAKDIVDSYKRIAAGHLSMWDAGKIKSNTSLIISTNQPKTVNPQQALLEQSGKEIGDKLKVKLNLEQLLFLFKMLYESDKIDAANNIEICRFIADYFSTPKANDISVDSLRKTWSDFNKKVPPFWFSFFNELAEKVKKDYPNNYRPIK